MTARPPARSPISFAPGHSLGRIDSLHLVIEHASHLASVRATVRNWLSAKLSESEVDDVLLACGEAIGNAIEHGTPPVDVHMSFGPASGGELRVQVHDRGRWLHDRDHAGRGFGLPIMRSLMTTVDVAVGDGTTLTLSKLVDPYR